MENVLIIEDDLAYCHLIERVLEKEGFRVRSATTMKEGLRLLEVDHPDAVVLDLGLPDSPVDETVQRLKEHTKSAIIVVLSGTSDPHAAEHCISRSASGFINKNAGLKYLGTEIRNAIRSFAKIQCYDSARSQLSALLV